MTNAAFLVLQIGYLARWVKVSVLRLIYHNSYSVI